MRVPTLLGLAALCLSLGLTGCSGKSDCDPDVMDCDDGGDTPPRTDDCNSKDDANTKPECQLTNCGDAGIAYISFSGDSDYYLAQMPANLTAQSLLHVYGGYNVPATAVNFAITLLKEDGTTAITRKVDEHGQAKPAPVDIIIPYSGSGEKLLVLVGDEAATPHPNFDVRNPYAIGYCVSQNPDTNEPNDTPDTATPITLTAQANGPEGQGKGYLSTENDKDYYSFDGSAAAGKILYLHVYADSTQHAPPYPYRLAYTLYDPDGNPISADNMPNQFLPIDLSTARKLTKAGTYKVEINGYQSPNGMMEPIPGDLALQYTVDVTLMDDLDANEPNDTPATAKVISMGLNSSNALSGRLGYVPDPDYFELDLAPTNSAGILHYKLTVAPGGSRFVKPVTPQGHIEDRQVRVMTLIEGGADSTERQNTCVQDYTVCPKGYDEAFNSGNAQGLVEALCMVQDPPLCLWAERDQDPNFKNYKNMEGVVPIPPHGSVAKYLLLSQDDETDYADDLVYTVAVSYEADDDETNRLGMPAETQNTNLASGGSFPTPPNGGAISGQLTYGYGHQTHDDWAPNGEGVRGATDYDAVPNDNDRFQINFAGVPTADYSWELAWDVDDSNDAGGAPPADLALELTFCRNALADGGCSGPSPTLLYSGDRLQPWYGQSLTDRQVLYSQNDNGSVTTSQAEAIGCFCYESDSVAFGHYFLNVTAANRISYARLNYTVRQGYTNYPASYSLDGGTVSCPAADAGGCQFSKQP